MLLGIQCLRFVVVFFDTLRLVCFVFFVAFSSTLDSILVAFGLLFGIFLTTLGVPGPSSTNSVALHIGAEAGSRCGGSGRQDPSVIVEGIVIVDDIVSVPLLLTPRRKGCCRFQHLRLYVCALRCSPLSDVMICVYIYIYRYIHSHFGSRIEESADA